LVLVSTYDEERQTPLRFLAINFISEIVWRVTPIIQWSVCRAFFKSQSLAPIVGGIASGLMKNAEVDRVEINTGRTPNGGMGFLILMDTASHFFGLRENGLEIIIKI